MAWQTGTGSIEIQRPLIMGILNVTPDSFSDGGQYAQPREAFSQAAHLVQAGAAVLDLGAESTRPGAAPLSSEEEWSRLAPVLARLAQDLPDVPLSLDTRHAATATQGLAKQVAILNDISGFMDPRMLELAQRQACGVIAMRSRWKDGVLSMPDYGSHGETSAHRALDELAAIKHRLLAAGISRARILLDPGFGFGTTFGEDEALWHSLPEAARILDWPVEQFCIGISRKRFLAWQHGAPETPPQARDPWTADAHRQAASWGFRVFRSHHIHSF